MKYSKKIICRRYREIDLLKWIHGGQEKWWNHKHDDDKPNQWCKVAFRILNWIDIKYVTFRNIWIDYIPFC